MAVMQMQRVSICALKKDRKAILEKIQSMGIMEMSQVAEDEDGFEKMDTISARQSFENESVAFRISTRYPGCLCTGKEVYVCQPGRQEAGRIRPICKDQRQKNEKFWKKPKGLLA